MSDGSSERPSLHSLLGGPLYSILSIATNIALGAGAIGTLWLLASLIFGNYADFGSVSKAAQTGALNNISLAQTLITWGFGAGALLAAVAYFGEEIVGYILLGGALLLGFGIPAGFQQFGGENFAVTKSIALAKVYGAFSASVLFPAAIGLLLIGYDVVLRLINTARRRPVVKVEKMTYGMGAQQENADRPARTSPLGKCWEGPFCRDFIRPHCPVFLKRQACWTNKVGCYCEEDIVSKAAAKVTGQSLPMAASTSRFATTSASAGTDFNATPDPMESGFQAIGSIGSTPSPMNRGMSPVLTPVARKLELTAAQKRERCRSCVIYNEHQREKYQLLLPIVVTGTIVVCGIFAFQFQSNATGVINGIELVVNRFSFLPGNGKVEVGSTSPGVAWALIGAGTIMIVSKALQILEWCVFKLKI